MINNDMRLYDYYTIGLEKDSYGQQKIPSAASPAGQIKMAIYPTSQNIQENILYKNASFVGFTHNTEINDDYVIDYNEMRLKVLYVAQGRLCRVFMAKVG